jgi:hypothetical protein
MINKQSEINKPVKRESSYTWRRAHYCLNVNFFVSFFLPTQQNHVNKTNIMNDKWRITNLFASSVLSVINIMSHRDFHHYHPCHHCC